MHMYTTYDTYMLLMLLSVGSKLVNLLKQVECVTLWGEREQVHVRYVEQLYVAIFLRDQKC